MKRLFLDISWRERLRRAWPQIVLGAVIGTGTLLLAVRGVEWNEVRAAILNTRGSMIALGLLSVAITIGLGVVRWWLLFAPHHRRLSWASLTGAILVGQTANIVIPARVGEIVRIYLFGSRERVSKTSVTATIVVERVLDLAVFAMAVLLLLVNVSLPPWMSRSGIVFMVMSGGLLLGTVGLTFWSEELLRLVERFAMRLPDKWGIRFVKLAEAAISGLRALREWRSALAVWMLSAAVLFGSIATNYILFVAMGFDIPAVGALLLTVVLRIGVAPPSLPGRLGLFQYLVVLALGMFGLDRTSALSYSLVLYGVAVVPILIVGTVWAFAYRWTPAEELEP